MSHPCEVIEIPADRFFGDVVFLSKLRRSNRALTAGLIEDSSLALRGDHVGICGILLDLFDLLLHFLTHQTETLTLVKAQNPIRGFTDGSIPVPETLIYGAETPLC